MSIKLVSRKKFAITWNINWSRSCKSVLERAGTGIDVFINYFVLFLYFSFAVGTRRTRKCFNKSKEKCNKRISELTEIFGIFFLRRFSWPTFLSIIRHRCQNSAPQNKNNLRHHCEHPKWNRIVKNKQQLEKCCGNFCI